MKSFVKPANGNPTPQVPKAITFVIPSNKSSQSRQRAMTCVEGSLPVLAASIRYRAIYPPSTTSDEPVM